MLIIEVNDKLHPQSKNNIARKLQMCIDKLNSTSGKTEYESTVNTPCSDNQVKTAKLIDKIFRGAFEVYRTNNPRLPIQPNDRNGASTYAYVKVKNDSTIEIRVSNHDFVAKTIEYNAEEMAPPVTKIVSIKFEGQNDNFETSGNTTNTVVINGNNVPVESIVLAEQHLCNINEVIIILKAIKDFVLNPRIDIRVSLRNGLSGQPSDTSSTTTTTTTTSNNPQNPSATSGTQSDSIPSDDMKESIRRIVRRTVAESYRKPRTVRLTESDLRRLIRESVGKALMVENVTDTSVNRARKWVMKQNPGMSWDEANRKVYSVMSRWKSLRDGTGCFTYGVVKNYDALIRYDAETVDTALRNAVKDYPANGNAKEQEVGKDLLGLSPEEFVERYSGRSDGQEDKVQYGQPIGPDGKPIGVNVPRKFGEYTAYLLPDNYEDAVRMFGNWGSWCIINNEESWNDCLNTDEKGGNPEGAAYLLVKNGYKKILKRYEKILDVNPDELFDDAEEIAHWEGIKEYENEEIEEGCGFSFGDVGNVAYMILVHANGNWEAWDWYDIHRPFPQFSKEFFPPRSVVGNVNESYWRNGRRNVVRLTESQLRSMVKDSLRNVLHRRA